MKAVKCCLISILLILLSFSFVYAQGKFEDMNAKNINGALEAGGLNTKGHPSLSKNYGPFLSKLGFSLISPMNYVPKEGDIRVFQPYPGGDPAGHMDCFHGKIWISEFKERNFWPSAKYKKYHPNFQIFRFRANK
jgi:hypothetical protein